MCELERQNGKAGPKSSGFREGRTEIPTSSGNCRLFVKNALPGEARLHNAKLVTQMSKGLTFYREHTSADAAETQ